MDVTLGEVFPYISIQHRAGNCVWPGNDAKLLGYSTPILPCAFAPMMYEEPSTVPESELKEEGGHLRTVLLHPHLHADLRVPVWWCYIAGETSIPLLKLSCSPEGNGSLHVFAGLTPMVHSR